MPTKKVKVEKVKVGDRIETSTGMRTVKDTEHYDSFVAVYVDDPASTKSKGMTVIDFLYGTDVTVQR